VWDTKNKNWLPISDSRLEFTDFYLTGDAKPFHLKDHFCDECGGGSNMIGIFDYKIMQYTGLKDKNGKEIYEGDICKNGDYIKDAHSYNYRTEEVKYIEAEGCLVGWNYNADGMTCEIIGNIYENPDLIKLIK